MKSFKVLGLTCLSASLLISEGAALEWKFWKKDEQKVDVQKLQNTIDLERNRNRELRNDLREERRLRQEAIEGKAQFKTITQSKKDERRSDNQVAFEGASLPEVIENGLEQVIQNSTETAERITKENKISREEIQGLNQRVVLLEEKSEILEAKDPFKARSIKLLVKGEESPIEGYRSRYGMVYDLDLMALSRLFEGFEFTTLKISAINFLGKKIKGSPFTPKNFKQFKVVGQKDMPIQAEIKMKSIVNRFLVEVGGVDEINRPFHLSGYLNVKFDDSLTWMVCESYGDDYAFIKGAEPVAASYYHRALQLDSSNAILCAKMGSALNGMGQFDKAARFYERSLEIDPMNIDTLNNYEICLGNLQLRVKHKAILADPTRAFDEPIVHSYQRSQRTIHDQKAFSKRMKTDQVIQKEVSFFEQYAE